jgi:hypothetical protein
MATAQIHFMLMVWPCSGHRPTYFCLRKGTSCVFFIGVPRIKQEQRNIFAIIEVSSLIKYFVIILMFPALVLSVLSFIFSSVYTIQFYTAILFKKTESFFAMTGSRVKHLDCSVRNILLLPSTFLPLHSHSAKPIFFLAPEPKIVLLLCAEIVQRSPGLKVFRLHSTKVKQSRYTPWRRLGGEEI